MTPGPVTPRGRAGAELVVGVLLLLAVAVSGLYFTVRPWPTFFDRWAFQAIGFRHHSDFLLLVTRLGSPFVVGAAAVAGFLAAMRRNRPRAVALLVGPTLAVALCDWVVKPVVGRTFAGVESFPSGTVTAVAAMATVLVLATPDRWRSVAGTIGGTVTLLTGTAVVALGWHFPTDAFAGVQLGVGVVLLTDCATRWSSSWRASRRGRAHSGPRPDAERSAAH